MHNQNTTNTYLVHQRPAEGHVLDRGEGQIETVHVVLRENAHTQLWVHANVSHLWHQLALQ